jgi:hypothetical protein
MKELLAKHIAHRDRLVGELANTRSHWVLV